MLGAERQQDIVRRVNADGVVEVSALGELYGVTPDCIGKVFAPSKRRACSSAPVAAQSGPGPIAAPLASQRAGTSTFPHSAPWPPARWIS